MASLFLRIFLPPLLAAVALSGCVPDYYPGSDGNIFLRHRRPPKYGHGGTDTPPSEVAQSSRAGRQPRADVEGNVGAAGSGETQYLGSRSERREETEPPAERSTDPDTTESQPSRPSESGDSTTSRTEESPPKSKPPAEDSNLQFGIPVPGKEGLVYSPYYSGGYVDVKGMPPGSKARCPYTKRIFRVP
jgi:hypothetical protein